MFSYQPKTENELIEQNLLQKGEGQFEVIESKFKKSKNGNPMIELKIKAWDITGKSQLIFDYLVADSSFEYKIRHFCDSVGLTSEYENGTFNENLCMGRTGTCKIDVRLDKTNSYPPKNVIADYLKPANNLINSQPSVEFNDDIPF